MANKIKLAPVVMMPRSRKSRIGQLKLESVLLMRRELREMEESIAVALSNGARVEPGVHTAELIPVRKNGKLYLKVVIQ